MRKYMFVRVSIYATMIYMHIYIYICVCVCVCLSAYVNKYEYKLTTSILVLYMKLFQHLL